MSDDPKDNPPAKLKLSRDLKARDEPKTGETPPSMKLKRKEPAPATADAAKAPPPAEPKKDPAPTTPSSTSAGGAAEKPGYDPDNPFGGTVQQGEIKKNSRPPPELPSEPAPKIEEGSGAKVEAAIDSLSQKGPKGQEGQKEGEAARKSHLLPSIIVLLVLLLVLAGAGYGLWKVLQSPADSGASGTAAAPAPESEPPKKGPIQKAKDAIAKVPLADVDAITAQEAPEPPAEKAQTGSGPVEESAPPAPPATTNSIEANKQSVAQYLSGIHIGGVRKGGRPMILIGGRSFQVGDLVQTETGLKFDGLRDGKLAFRDSHGIIYLKSF